MIELLKEKTKRERFEISRSQHWKTHITGARTFEEVKLFGNCWKKWDHTEASVSLILSFFLLNCQLTATNSVVTSAWFSVKNTFSWESSLVGFVSFFLLYWERKQIWCTNYEYIFYCLTNDSSPYKRFKTLAETFSLHHNNTAVTVADYWLTEIKDQWQSSRWCIHAVI